MTDLRNPFPGLAKGAFPKDPASESTHQGLLGCTALLPLCYFIGRGLAGRSCQVKKALAEQEEKGGPPWVSEGPDRIKERGTITYHSQVERSEEDSGAGRASICTGNTSWAARCHGG